MCMWVLCVRLVALLVPINSRWKLSSFVSNAFFDAVGFWMLGCYCTESDLTHSINAEFFKFLFEKEFTKLKQEKSNKFGYFVIILWFLMDFISRHVLKFGRSLLKFEHNIFGTAAELWRIFVERATVLDFIVKPNTCVVYWT